MTHQKYQILYYYSHYKPQPDSGFLSCTVHTRMPRSRLVNNWLDAIDKDSLTWYHVSDLQGWNSAAGKLYAVNAIPHSVMLDRNGTIIAKNLRGEELRDKIAKLLD